ncbi:MAG: hypothetical protein AAFV80_21130 [Bacteroidota bacterium]
MAHFSELKFAYSLSYPCPVLYVTDVETNFGGAGHIVQCLIKYPFIPLILAVGIAYDTSFK